MRQAISLASWRVNSWRIAVHGIADQPLIGLHVALRRRRGRVELDLLADHVVARLPCGARRWRSTSAARCGSGRSWSRGLIGSKTSSGGRFSRTTTSVTCTGRFLPARMKNGTSCQRQVSTKKRTAAKVSTGGVGRHAGFLADSR